MFEDSDFEIHQLNGFRYLDVPHSLYTQNLVLLHGMFGGLSNYDQLIKHIQNYNVIVPSLPIYESDASQLSIRSLSRWLSSFCSALGLTSPVLLGNSLGGHIALDYTINHPENVSALVLTGSSGLMEKKLGSSCPKRYDREYIRRQAAQTFYDDRIDDALLDDIMDVVTNPDKLRNILTLARDTHEYNMQDRLSAIKQKVLLIWGKNDQITPPEVAKKFYELLPDPQLVWIDKCGHAPMMEHPGLFAKALKTFLISLNPDTKETDDLYYEENYSH